jgi:hypothetical protein
MSPAQTPTKEWYELDIWSDFDLSLSPNETDYP